MSLTYKKIVNKPEMFTRLLGINRLHFDQIVEVLTPVWCNYLSNSYYRPGRAYKQDLGTMVILLLIYYRSYITQEFVGYLFDLDKSNVCHSPMI
ncbi:MAG: transposase family protein [Amoebophilaceae bacterium]|nr:transposase family protein [Amoebophilaceae bacterium]